MKLSLYLDYLLSRVKKKLRNEAIGNSGKRKTEIIKVENSGKDIAQ